MPLESLLSFVPAFVLAFFRMAGMMLSAPILGGGRVRIREGQARDFQHVFGLS